MCITPRHRRHRKKAKAAGALAMRNNSPKPGGPMEETRAASEFPWPSANLEHATSTSSGNDRLPSTRRVPFLRLCTACTPRGCRQADCQHVPYSTRQGPSLSRAVWSRGAGSWSRDTVSRFCKRTCGMKKISDFLLRNRSRGTVHGATRAVFSAICEGDSPPVNGYELGENLRSRA